MFKVERFKLIVNKVLGWFLFRAPAVKSKLKSAESDDLS